MLDGTKVARSVRAKLIRHRSKYLAAFNNGHGFPPRPRGSAKSWTPTGVHSIAHRPGNKDVHICDPPDPWSSAPPSAQRCAPPTPAGRGVHDATDSSGAARRCDRPVCPPPAMTICEAAAAGPCGGALFAGPLVRLEQRQSSRHEPRPGPGAMGHSVRYARRDASTRLGPALVATDDEAPTLDARARTPQGRACSAWGTRWPVPPRGRGDRAWPVVVEVLASNCP